ncbi:MAG: hypothetical protein V7609_1792 [Verrucomicrobiota bacterium]
MRKVRADKLASYESGKRFLALGWIDECSLRRQDCGQAKDAARAGLFIRIRVLVMVAAISRHIGFHFGAATRLLYLPNRSLRGNHCESDRRRDHQTNQKPHYRSHPDVRYSLGYAGSIFMFDFGARIIFAAALRSRKEQGRSPREGDLRRPSSNQGDAEKRCRNSRNPADEFRAIP